MDAKDFVAKPCCVVLEQLTPQKQLALSAELRNVINERNMLTTRTKQKVLQDLEKLNESEEDNNVKMKIQTVQEILDSEVKYLKQLELIIMFFMEPIEKQNLLNKEDFRIVFGNIKTLYRVNGELLNELKQNVSNISKAFEKMAPYFKLYSSYAYNFKTSLHILQKAQTDKGNFIKYVERQESRPEVQNKLSALLIAPIQRIPRYRMLLKQVLDYTAPTEEDYSILKAAVRRIEEVADHINHLVDNQENMQHMLDLQTRLLNQQPSLIKPGRRIIKEGVLSKMAQNGSAYRKKYFILMNDIIIYCKIKSSNPKAPNSLKCSGIMPLSKCKVIDDRATGCFKIVCQNEEIALYHEKVDESQKWREAINNAILKHAQNRLTLRKESSTRRPVKRKHLDEYEELGVSPGKPRKKRDAEKNGHQNATSSTSLISEDNQTKNKNCFRLSKRPALHQYGDYRDTSTSFSTIRETDSFKSLNNVNEMSYTDNDHVNNHLKVAKNVFVFGSDDNKNGGFFGNFFRGIGNSVKTMFGFK